MSSITANDDSPTVPSVHRVSVRLVIFLTACAAALSVTGYYGYRRHLVKRHIAKLTALRDELQAVHTRIEKSRQQGERDKQVLFESLRICRVAEDIPELGGNRIVATMQGSQKLMLYVPSGSHRLVISAKWHAQESGEPAVSSPWEGEERWIVPIEQGGYHFHLSVHRQGGPVEWELTGNRSDFEKQTGRVPFDDFAGGGESWRLNDVLCYPNQVGTFSSATLAALVQDPASWEGVEIMNATLYGTRKAKPYEISVRVSLISDGPLTVSATDALRLSVIGQQDLLMPYAGGGKYDLRLPATSPR